MAIVGFISLGCAKNQVDCERMMFRVQDAGHAVTGELAGCDVVVVNTCGFIDSAKSEAIDHILMAADLKQKGLVKKILVTGCLAQRYQDEILKELPEVDGVMGTGSYTDIVHAIEDLMNGMSVRSFNSIDLPEAETGRLLTTPKHYAYLKIAEGCDNHCAYCVIPSLRGKYRSRRPEAVMAEARHLVSMGVKELIVVAQDTSRYGTDLEENRRLLPELLRNLCMLDDLKWVRLHYVYPDEIDEELLHTLAEEPKIVKYLDMPIQHCNDEILTKMNRRGSGVFLRELIKKIRDMVPGIVIRTSLITGLPGEGDQEFLELKQFLQSMQMERVGVFPFSPEEGTEAEKMPHVSEEIARQRAEALELLQSDIMDAFNQTMVGRKLDVLVDGYDDEFGQWYGRTYADSPEVDGRIWLSADEPLHAGDFVHAVVDGCADGDLTGYLAEEV